MSMEIRGVAPYFDISGGASPAPPVPGSPQQTAATLKTSQSQPHINTVLSDLQKVSQIFDRRLQFSVARDIDRVVVKVIDTETDKVIRELPPKEIQELYRRIREAVGLLFDHKI